MNVTMLRKVSGTRDGVDWPDPGDSIDVPADEAELLIGNGLAKAADEPAPAPEPEPSRKGSRQATNEPG
ncbi:MAG: hypothetical protein R2761_16230 [Acidimicrobiales bacterium]